MKRSALPCDGAAGKAAGGPLLFIRQHLGIGKPGSIIDGDVQAFPASAAFVALARPVAGDPVPDPVDPAELLGIDMDQFTRMLTLVAQHRRTQVER